MLDPLMAVFLYYQIVFRFHEISYLKLGDVRGGIQNLKIQDCKIGVWPKPHQFDLQWQYK